MQTRSSLALVGLMISALSTGCGNASTHNRVVVIDGVELCGSGTMSVGACRNEVGGAPQSAEGSDLDRTGCSDLGFTEECGAVEAVASSAAYARDAADRPAAEQPGAGSLLRALVPLVPRRLGSGVPLEEPRRVRLWSTSELDHHADPRWRGALAVVRQPVRWIGQHRHHARPLRTGQRVRGQGRLEHVL